MFVALWSAKGGVGVTSTVGLLGLGLASRGREVLLVDLCGDLPIVLGVDCPETAGVTEWSALDRPSVDALGRIEHRVQPGVALVPRGQGPLGPETAAALHDALEADSRVVIVDCGDVGFGDGESAGSRLARMAEHTWMVTRPCFLALRAAQLSTLEPTGVVVVNETRRFLGRADIELAANAPIVADVAADWSIARSIDTGLTRASLPRKLVHTLGKVLDDAA